MSVHKDAATGKWFYTFRWTDTLGKSHAKKKRGFRTKREAQRAEQKAQETSAPGTPGMSVNELWRRCQIADRKAIDSTKYKQDSDYRKSIEPYLGQMKLKDVTPEVIDDWVDTMLKEYASSTVATKRAILSKMFSFAVNKGYITRSPVQHSSSVKVSSPEADFWEVDDFKEFIDYENQAKFRLLFTFLFCTGLRIGEAMALRWSDYTGNAVHVTKTVKDVKGGTVLGDVPKTSNSIRWVSLPSVLTDELDEWKEHQKKMDGFHDDYFIFGNVDFMSPCTARNHLNVTIRRAKVKRITLHGLRHSHASYLIYKRLPDVVIARRLGHTVNTLHKTYAHIYKQLDDELSDVLEEMADGL